MNEQSVIAVLITGVTGLCTVVGVLFRMLQKHTETSISRLQTQIDECENDRNELWAAIAKQGGVRVETIKPSKPHGYAGDEDQRKTSARNQ